jgi:hypothetical protein
MYQLLFSCCDRISDRNNLREEGFILAYGFREFSPSCGEGVAEHKQFISWWLRSREREMEYRKKPGQDIAPKDTSPVTCFFQLGPTSQ